MEQHAGSGKPYSTVWVSLKDRARIKVTNTDELATFQKFFDEPYYAPGPVGSSRQRAARESRRQSTIALHLQRLLPELRADPVPAIADGLRGGQFRAGDLRAVDADRLSGRHGRNMSAPGYDLQAQGLSSYSVALPAKHVPYTTLVGFDDTLAMPTRAVLPTRRTPA